MIRADRSRNNSQITKGKNTKVQRQFTEEVFYRNGGSRVSLRPDVYGDFCQRIYELYTEGIIIF